MFQKEPWNWPESAKRQKNERKYAMNSSDRKLHHDEMEVVVVVASYGKIKVLHYLMIQILAQRLAGSLH